MDSLFDILSRKDYDLPPEVVAIKQYVRDEFQAEVEVRLQGEKDIVINGRSSALIGSLRLRSPQIKKAAGTTKRLIFRVG